MLRLFLVTAVIIIASILAARSCFFTNQSFRQDQPTVSLQPGRHGTDTQPLPALKPLAPPGTSWIDELMVTYINTSGNTLIRATRQENTRIEWLPDRVEDTDTATFLVYHIGHDVTDEGGTNPRFVTDGWVYIDTLTRQLYEYDIAGDRLTPWQARR
ncbi:MAG: hypothetical protein ABW019_14785 [Chitinophagaceae bacterium]